MSDQLYPTDLTDRQWEYIKPLLPPAKLGGRPCTVDRRRILNAILYVVVSGVQWRLLPREYPNWKTVYHYFRIWRITGIWRRIHDTLRAALRQRIGRHKHPTAGALDSQSIKTAHVAGARGYDTAKRITGRKRHVLVDTLGLLLAIRVTPANVSDTAGAKLVLQQVKGGGGKKLRRIWVDGGYKAGVFAWVVQHCRCILVAVVRSANQPGFVVLPKRWLVERTFAWLMQYRRLRSDYEVRSANSEAMIYVAMIRLMLRRVAPG
jgi:putative transposase